jgi:hypothetical protein
VTELGLTDIDITSGIAVRNGEGFCKVTATADDGTVMLGQLDPTAVRLMALGWLEAAEAAIHDAAVFQILTTKLDVKEDAAAMLVADLREHRADRKEDGRR